MALAVIGKGTVSASLHKHFTRNGQTQFFKYDKCICNLFRTQKKANAFPRAGSKCCNMSGPRDLVPSLHLI